MKETKNPANICSTPSCQEPVGRAKSRCETCAKERRLAKERIRKNRPLRGVEKEITTHLADDAQEITQRLNNLITGLENFRDSPGSIPWELRKVFDNAINATHEAQQVATQLHNDLRLWKERLEG